MDTPISQKGDFRLLPSCRGVWLLKNTHTIQVSQCRCYLITDGRSRAQVSDLKLSVPTVLIDTEDSTVKRGRGVNIAEQLGAQYYLLPS